MERLPMEALEDAINLEKAVIEACEKSEVDAPANDRVVFEFLQELKEYRCTGLTPEKIIEVDKAFYDRCQEINRLNAELAELKKQPQGELISRNELIEVLKKQAENNAIAGYMTAYDVIRDCIDTVKEQPVAYDVEKVVEQEHNYLSTITVPHTKLYRTVMDIVRKGGKE